MRKLNLTYAMAFTVLAFSVACEQANNAVDENRPDAKAVARAAEQSNTSSPEPPRTNEQRPGAAEDRSATTAAGNVERSAERAGDTMQRTTDNAADAAGRAANSATSAAGNSMLTAKVQAKFAADATVKGRRINVDSRDGVVTLRGSVTTKAESDKAEQLARETDGVTRVVNNLKVDPNAR